ncbi:hypothetical protein ACFWPH_26570 [Nocardia sp. NPDC058499]|uniref:hypothetical protein n=1 Tax=Nocardia sp. NPDC058499 TaxID=3346530 RepID=UPI00364D4A17
MRASIRAFLVGATVFGAVVTGAAGATAADRPWTGTGPSAPDSSSVAGTAPSTHEQYGPPGQWDGQ